MARSFHGHWLVDSSTSVMKDNCISSFINMVIHLMVQTAEPFSGKLILPTNLQVSLLLKRWGQNRKEELQCHSWRDNQQSYRGHTLLELGQAWLGTRQSPLQRTKCSSFSRTSIRRKTWRTRNLWRTERFEEDFNKLLDISHPNLEKTLSENRIRGNLEGRKSEDLNLLQDQRGERIIIEVQKLELLKRFLSVCC